MRCLCAALLLAIFTMGATAEEISVSPSAYTDDPVLAQYLQEAAEEHPTLRGLHAEWLAQLERIPQATSLEDPMLSFGQFLLSDTARFRVAVSQRFPWFGTLDLRGERAAIEAEAIFADMTAERNRLIADVKQAYYEYAYLAAQQAVLASQLDVLDQIEETVTTQFGLGFVAEDALVRVQIERARLLDEIRGLEQYRLALSARLAERIGRPVDVVLPYPEDLPAVALPADEAAVFAAIEGGNPALIASRERIEAQEASVKLAQKAGYPSIAVGIDYTSISKPRKIRPDRPYPASLNAGRRLANTLSGAIPADPINTAIDLYALGTSDEPMSYSDGGEDNLAVTLSMNVPVWRKRVKAGIREAELGKEAAEAKQAGLFLALKRSALQTLFEYRDALRRMRLYEDELIPQAERVYESILTGYSLGVSEGLVELLDSEQQLLAFYLEQYASRREALIAAAELEYLMGRPFRTAPSEDQEIPGNGALE